MVYEFKEEDWQVFRKNVPVWQERFMTSLVDKYTEILMSDDRGSDRFWKLKESIEEDSKKKGVVMEMKRSLMVDNLIYLLDEGAITADDLDVFTNELKDAVVTAASALNV